MQFACDFNVSLFVLRRRLAFLDLLFSVCKTIVLFVLKILKVLI
jgi:hypothetical protein